MWGIGFKIEAGVRLISGEIENCPQGMVDPNEIPSPWPSSRNEGNQRTK